MTHPKIIEQVPISMAQLRVEIKEIKKRDSELSFRGQKTEEYLDEMTVLNEKETEELHAKIKRHDIPRLKDEHIFKIIDIMPRNVNELKTVMQGYALTVTNDNLAKIQKDVDEFLPKKAKTA